MDNLKSHVMMPQTRSLIWDEETKTQDISPIRRQNRGNRRNNFKTKFEPHEKKTPSGMNTLSSTASL